MYASCTGLVLAVIEVARSPSESFRSRTPHIHPRTEGLQRSHSVLGLNDSRGIILSGIERLHGSYSFLDGATLGSHSVLEWNDSRGVLQSWNRTTPGESFCHGMERLQGSISVLGSNVSSGVILS